MARVTVEDCIPVVNNRFDLVLYAAERARAIARGSEITVQKDDDKDSVVALREIAERNLELEVIEDGIVRSLQMHFERDEAEDDPVEAYARSLGLDEVLSASEVEAASLPDAEDSGIRVAESAVELGAGDDGDEEAAADGEEIEDPDDPETGPAAGAADLDDVGDVIDDAE